MVSFVVVVVGVWVDGAFCGGGSRLLGRWCLLWWLVAVGFWVDGAFCGGGSRLLGRWYPVCKKGAASSCFSYHNHFVGGTTGRFPRVHQ
jgi:hypothetical protein